MSEWPLPRRAFLGYASLGASAIWMPHWLAAGFEADEVQESPPQIVPRKPAREEVPPLDRVLKQALERAHVVGKPLLVFVVPELRERVWLRQEAFGQYLNLCDDDALADLTLCEVVCARMSDVAAVLPGTKVRGEPLLILVETDGAELEVKAIDAGLDEIEIPYLLNKPQGEREKGQKEFEARVKSRVDRLAGLVQGSVAGDLATIERRAQQVRKALGESSADQVARVVENLSGSDEEMDSIAAILRLVGEENPDQRMALQAALARSARIRLRTQPPDGAW